MIRLRNKPSYRPLVVGSNLVKEAIIPSGVNCWKEINAKWVSFGTSAAFGEYLCFSNALPATSFVMVYDGLFERFRLVLIVCVYYRARETK